MLTWEDVEKLPLDNYTAMLRDGAPFSFSRWGDGEWKSLTGQKDGANCDGHTYFTNMGSELADILRRRPPYILGLQSLALRIYPHRIHPFLENNRLTDLKWVDSDVLHRAVAVNALRDQWGRWLQALQSRAVLVVGPPHLREPLRGLFNCRDFVEVPRRNCYLSLMRITAATMDKLAAATEPMVVCLSCGMPAEILLDRLYTAFGGRHTIIDTGSVWDPYAGIHSRKYMREPQFQPAPL